LTENTVTKIKSTVVNEDFIIFYLIDDVKLDCL